MSGASSSNAESDDFSVSDVTVTEPGVIRRAVGAAAIGNVTEWFDFGVYSYLAVKIESVFFAGLSPTMGTIATLGTFAAAFLVRPFGGLFFGPLGDRIGRQKVLSLTVIMMAISTFIIGILPDYHAIGVAAPMLLLLARLLQGFSTGGEYGGAMAFIAEYAPDRKRGFLCSFLEFGTLTGYALGASFATGLELLLSEEDLLAWGWRIPFLIAGPIGGIGLYLRMKLEETPAFAKIAAESEGREGNQTLAEFRKIFVNHWPAMLVCGGIVLVFNVTNYVLTSYMPTYLTQTLPDNGHAGTDSTTSQVLQIVVLLVSMVLITFIGRLSDKIGRKPVMYTGCVLLVVLAIPSVMLLKAGGTFATFSGLMLMGLMLLCFNSTSPSVLPALFPTDIRYGGLSIAFNISVSLFGGTAATVIAALIALTGNLDIPAYYLMGAGVIGAVAVYFAKESAGKRLPGSPPAAVDHEEAKVLVGAKD
ncbi:MFS transporter [Saccharopolyspora sp. 6T]|uniref:MFS transporter n=1 Tax=Saccharopolyspora sp. 6T TaxID=2877238 RepID=UPI001CD42ED1|nr:MFS transporter [Saccharopolyspora sp. 6T]MCA1185316.1 MFS transporter [Saccharopolyspora sp. 6T]